MLANDLLHLVALGRADHEGDAERLLGGRMQELQLEEIFGIDETGDIQGNTLSVGTCRSGRAPHESDARKVP